MISSLHNVDKLTLDAFRVVVAFYNIGNKLKPQLIRTYLGFQLILWHLLYLFVPVALVAQGVLGYCWSRLHSLLHLQHHSDNLFLPGDLSSVISHPMWKKKEEIVKINHENPHHPSTKLSTVTCDC